MDKDQSRRVRGEIRRALVELWDPIGIKDEPNAQDEYDLYIGDVLELLNSDATEEQIASHLWKIIEESINVHPQKGATERTVKALKSIVLV